MGKERITVSLEPEEALVLQWLTVKYPEEFPSRTAAATALIRAAIKYIRSKFRAEIEEYKRKIREAASSESEGGEE